MSIRWDLLVSIYGVKHPRWLYADFPHIEIDYERAWEVIDSFPQDERQLIHLLWESDGKPTRLSRAEALRRLGLKASAYSRAWYSLWRHKYKFVREFPSSSVEYGYA